MSRTEVLATVIVAALGGGTLAQAVNAWAGRRKTRADATSVIVQAAAGAIGVQEDVIERLQQQTQALVLEADNLRREVAALRTENATLHREVADLKLLLVRLEQTLGRPVER